MYTISSLRNRTFYVPLLILLCQCNFAFIFSIFHCMNILWFTHLMNIVLLNCIFMTIYEVEIFSYIYCSFLLPSPLSFAYFSYCFSFYWVLEVLSLYLSIYLPTYLSVYLSSNLSISWSLVHWPLQQLTFTASV